MKETSGCLFPLQTSPKASDRSLSRYLDDLLNIVNCNVGDLSSHISILLDIRLNKSNSAYTKALIFGLTLIYS